MGESTAWSIAPAACENGGANFETPLQHTPAAQGASTYPSPCLASLSRKVEGSCPKCTHAGSDQSSTIRWIGLPCSASLVAASSIRRIPELRYSRGKHKIVLNCHTDDQQVAFVNAQFHARHAVSQFFRELFLMSTVFSRRVAPPQFGSDQGVGLHRITIDR